LETKKLGTSDLDVTVVGLGAWQFGTERWGYGQDFTKEDVLDAIRVSLDHGINWIDTAEVYGNGKSEELIREALGERIKDVIIATKVAGTHARAPEVKRALEGSLKRLQRDWVDLLQFHWPNHYVPIEETMRALEDLVREGKVRYIGISNFNGPLMRLAREALDDAHLLVSNQVRYSLLDRSIEKEIYPTARELQISIIAYSPLAQGLLTGKYDRDHLPEDPIRKDHPLFQEPNLSRALRIVEVLKDLARKYEKTPAQVALRWLIQRDGVVVIPGAKHARQAEQNAGAMGWSLSVEDWNRLEEASRGEITYFTA